MLSFHSFITITIKEKSMPKKANDSHTLSKNTIHSTSPDNKYRYALGTKGKNTLYCFGINPSTATPENYDPTMRKVSNVALHSGFDSFIMLNIYPLRATNPGDLPYSLDKNEHDKNIKIVMDLINDESTIWAAWGNLIDSRPWLRGCLDDIYQKIQKSKKNINWVKMGSLTIKQNPRHPLYLKYQDFSEFRW